MRVLLWSAFWAAALVGLWVINTPPSDKAKQAMIEAEVVKSENAIRPTLPKKIDEITTLVGISHVASKIQYEIVVDLTEAASATTSSLLPRARDRLLFQICSNSEVVKVLGIGVSYEYIYRDEKSNSLGNIIIRGGDCKS